MPANGLVEFAHALLASRATDKPRIERIIEHGLIGAPAMWIVVHMFLNLEHLALGLQVHADADIERLVLFGELLVVGVLHVTSTIAVPFLHIYIFLYKIGVEVLHEEVFALQVNHRTLGSLFVDEHDGTDTCLLGYEGVVGTKVGGDMYDTCTILGCHVVAGNHAESFTHRLDHGQQLLVFNTYEVCAFVMAHYAIGKEFLSLLELRHFATIGNLCCCVEIGRNSCLCHHDCDFLSGIGVVCLQGHIVNLGTYTKRGVGGKCPRCGRPSHEERSAPPCHLGLWRLHAEQGRAGRVLYVTIASWLVQLVTRETCTCCRAIGLNGVTLVEKALFIELLQEIPQRFDILVVVGDVGVIEVNEVAHAFREFTPLGGIHHHVLTTLLVVFLGRNIFSRFLVVDVGLGNSQRLLHAQLHWQSMCVPACFALHLEALHGLVAVKRVFQRTS